MDTLSGPRRRGVPPEALRRTGGFTLVELLVVIVIIGILAALLIPAIIHAINETKVTSCANNLKRLYESVHIYSVRTLGKMPAERGGAFWLKLQQIDPPIIDRSMADVYACAKKGDPPGPGTTDYRGPAEAVSRYGQGDPLGGDLSDNHGEGYGINVVRMSGDVQRAFPGDELWMAADAKLVP